jgi:hypothetical protein
MYMIDSSITFVLQAESPEFHCRRAERRPKTDVTLIKKNYLLNQPRNL